MNTVGIILEHLRRLRVAKVRGSPYEDREAAMLASTIGAIFTEAALLRGDPLHDGGRDCEIVCDEIGVGSGVGSRLREVQYFMASRQPSEKSQGLHANLRAECYGRLRDKMIRGEVGLPYSEELAQELRTARWGMNSSGRFLVQSKDEWRKVLGRSPDKLDAVVMALASRSYASFGGAGDLTGPIPF